MTENAEAERHLSQTLSAALSVALNVALQAQQARGNQARRAEADSEEQRHELGRQLAADRETAAVMWRRVDDPHWIRDRPVEVAETWASARAWESVDLRAAEARAKFDTVLDAMYGRENPLIAVARESEDYTALAGLLQRAVEVTPQQAADPRTYEMVPEHERREWLERQLWGPESDPEARIAASSQLRDLEQGLPVTVLREMEPETRQAWIELGELDPSESRAWREAWLERQVWGPDTPGQVRSERTAALEELRSGGVDRWEPDAWHAWVAEVRERDRARGEHVDEATQEHAKPGQTVGRGVQRENTAVERAPQGGDVGESAAARESKEERMARTAATVREVWPEKVAEEVVGRPAFGAFAHRLHQLEGRGYDMRDMLQMVPPDALVGVDRYGKRVRNPAAFAEWHIKQLASSLPEKAAAEAGVAELERYVADQGRYGRDRSLGGREESGAADSDQTAVETDRGLAQQERDARDRQLDVAVDAPPSEVAAVGAEAERREQRSESLEAAANTHDAAETIRRGAYETGADPARLAGESYPRDINESLKSAQRSQAKRQGQAPQARRFRTPTEKRTR